MMLPPVIRIFFAIDLPPMLKTQVAAFIAEMKKKSRTNAIRWTKPENLHITLQFLANVQTEDLSTIINHARSEITETLEHVTFQLGGIKLFPYPFRPRVIVLDVIPHADLAMIATAVGKAVERCGYELEKRAYHPHVTLARIKHSQDVNMSFINACSVPEFGKIQIEEVKLYRSEPGMDGSRYTELESFPLVKQMAAEAF